MFAKFAKSTKSTSKSTATELTRTTKFLECLVSHNIRLSYGGLATVAEELGEHTPSGLSAGQRGAQLCRKLPAELQPHVCRSDGGYHKNVRAKWTCEVPSDLRDRPVIAGATQAREALQEWEAAQAAEPEATEAEEGQE